MKTDLISGIGLCLSSISVIAALILGPFAKKKKQVETRLRSFRVQKVSFADARGRETGRSLRLLSAIGRLILNAGLLPNKTIEDLNTTVSVSGYSNNFALAAFIGAKVVFVVALPLLTAAIIKAAEVNVSALIAMAVAGVIGLMVPDFIVRSMRKRYLRAVEAGLPAALDLLIICAEAGMALEAGFERVAFEAREGAKATATELRVTANEMKVLASRRDALLNMGRRTGLDSMSRFGAVLGQSLQYGTPLSHALRLLAGEMRQAMLTRFEARAARIPVLLTIPMIVFILPCIFVVVAGPAAVQVTQAFGK